MSDSRELYKKYRPSKLSEVVGQAEAVEALANMIANKSVPHAILFTGPSGTGKTTLARIVKNALNCSNTDFFEINCASCEPMATVRNIQELIEVSPWCGPCKVWILDEVQSWSRAGFAQQGLLKVLEDTPKYAYFFLATTDASKVHSSIKTRCTEIKTRLLDRDEMRERLIAPIAESERIVLDDLETARLIESSEGSARLALVHLDAIAHLSDREARLNFLSGLSNESAAPIRLCQALLSRKSTWQDIADILREIKEAPEDARREILSYANGALMKAANPKAAQIISWFRLNFSDGGKADLTYACYQVFSQK